MVSQERQQAEKEFYEHFYGDVWDKQDQLIDESIVPLNMLVYWRLVKEHINELKQRQSIIRVLDCGCGHGVLSVLLAKIGAEVISVDISFNSIKTLRRLASVNGVDEQILTVIAALEALPFKDEYFDCIVGSRILHHVDLRYSGFELSCVLKTGSKGFFWECTDKNLILRLARNHIRRFVPLPKFGTKDEHPLTKDEIENLGIAFESPVRIVAAPFYFFSLISQYLSHRYVESMTKVGTRLDTLIEKCFPQINRFSFHQILVLKKRRDR
ncbi:MAG: class I SAM-dependent methyltransferase [Deltaproteobacteria bacterium]|nr:class I SAM-dependent methyltransferase [Deltaproteobacteria bacterium]MBW2141990.1 class I SAM-dependent methyltransferase [Deltaproteobacteria bacterium]MBW2324221.1 class I SAM-dependent methyltransferase [Deltaproteobacteria bacterium]